MSRTILITGANGTVSSALLHALRAADLKLRALVRNASKATHLEATGIEVIVGDLDDPNTLAPAFEGVTDLWLLTAAGPRAPENSMNAVWAARQAGVERVVRLSALGAAHDAPTRNGRLHALSDDELQQSGLRWTILRPHFYMQNLLHMAQSIAAGGAFYMNMGQGRLGMIDVRDVAECAARVLRDAPERHHGKIYTPTGPQAISFADVAEQLGQAIGRSVNYVAVPDETARRGMLEMGASPWMAGSAVEYGQAYASGWGDFTTADFKSLVGHPARSFAEFARDHAAAFKGSTVSPHT